MKLNLTGNASDIEGEINISGSKSESNRLLILQALYPSIKIKNLSDSDDTVVLKKALNSDASEIDIHHAGTAMRFLTAFFAIQENRTTILTGSPRMQERPIKILVNALRDLGAEIEYLKNDGFPPIKISGKKLEKNEVSLEANVSSQYISALSLIAPVLPFGLKINLKGKLTSQPYLKMTLKLLEDLGVEVKFEKSVIEIKPLKSILSKSFTVESDWSSASYFFSIIALSENGKIQLNSFKKESLQGDSELVSLFKNLGVKAEFSKNYLVLQKEENFNFPETFKTNLSKTPDLAQTLAVTCFGLKIPCQLTGLHTLKIKETDRLVALKSELEKLGASVEITENSLSLKPNQKINPGISIKTYNDHRMAMAFAPLALKTEISIENPEVVSKSYPGFWEDLGKLRISGTNS
jgi:3-phosphoshikimate 1-carboxyvinyltransferase